MFKWKLKNYNTVTVLQYFNDKSVLILKFGRKSVEIVVPWKRKTRFKTKLILNHLTRRKILEHFKMSKLKDLSYGYGSTRLRKQIPLKVHIR